MRKLFRNLFSECCLLSVRVPAAVPVPACRVFLTEMRGVSSFSAGRSQAVLVNSLSRCLSAVLPAAHSAVIAGKAPAVVPGEKANQL